MRSPTQAPAGASLRIAELTLSHFRGIEGPLSIDFSIPGHRAASMIISGDNGSGKSSICDALEFLFRGRVSRHLAGGVKVRREIRNLATGAKPFVAATLNTGRQISRGVKPDESRITALPDGPMTDFDLCPVVIRRDVVEGFWRTGADRRLTFFWDYLAPIGNVRSLEEEELLKKYDEAAFRLEQAVADLDRAFPRRHRPTKFEWPTREGGLLAVPSVAKTVRGRAGLSRDDWSVIERHAVALRAEQALRGRAEDARPKITRDFSTLLVVLRGIAPTVATDFRSISNHAWVKDLRIEFSEDGRLGILLVRDRGAPLPPESVLSEASLDLLAILIFVELHLACADLGQAKVIVLDDIFQSVDSTLRPAALNLIGQKMHDWQIILTVHDRLWLTLARRSLVEAQDRIEIRHLISNGFGGTPAIRGAVASPLRDLIEAQTSNASPVVIAGTAGRALESLLDGLSIRVNLPVQRQENDEYSIAQLLEPAKKVLEKHEDATVRDLMTKIDSVQFLRNKVGAHYQEWGDGLSDSEARAAADLVIDLQGHLTCPVCGRFGQKRNTQNGNWKMMYRCH